MDFDPAALGALFADPLVAQLVELGGLFLVGAFAHVVASRILLRLILRFVEISSIRWDDALVGQRFFARLAWLAPALVVWHGVQLLPHVHPAIATVVVRVAVASMVLVAGLALSSLLGAINEIYAADPENRARPIKGYLQVVKLVTAIVATILILATLMDRSPVLFLSGLGAMAAVLLLVFRDTLLSLVASIQLTSYDMVHVGDWIEMPQYGADGDVIDVALHTVVVQNWDKTITTIPTHKLIEGSFKNWRGMQRSGGRRIKRSLLIDVNTIRFLTDEEIQAFEGWVLLRDYVRRKRDELEEWNRDPERSPEVNANVRRLTNVGTLRAYIDGYLASHPQIHGEMTRMVRQLAPTPTGLPLEIYCFTTTTQWLAYEGIQADILDHVLAIVPDFDLRAFQAPAGRDLEALRSPA